MPDNENVTTTEEVEQVSEPVEEQAAETPESQETQEPVEQSDDGTPQETEDESNDRPEFSLDEDGNLQWNIDDEDGNTEDSTEEQPTEETSPEPPSTEEEPHYKVKVNGEEVEVSQGELLRGYLRQADYTRKTQELAERRRQLASQVPQYPPQQVPQNIPPVQRAPQQGADLNALAKQMAARQLRLDSVDDLSELNFDHTIAVMEAKEALINQQRTMATRQRNMQNLESQLQAEDPSYNEVMLEAQKEMENLPHGKYVKLQQAYEAGDPEPLRNFYKQVQKKYYAQAAQKVDAVKKTVPPKVEGAGKSPAAPKPVKKYDFRQFGHLSAEEKAQKLIEWGIV